jgi:aldehyde:ferredoxin oxidoreductase
MGTKEMRTKHDTVPDWVFADPAGKASFAKGSNRMDKEDINLAMDLYYEEMGWDKKTGSPTAAAYQKMGLATVADDLSKKQLLP